MKKIFLSLLIFVSFQALANKVLKNGQEFEANINVIDEKQRYRAPRPKTNNEENSTETSQSSEEESLNKKQLIQKLIKQMSQKQIPVEGENGDVELQNIDAKEQLEQFQNMSESQLLMVINQRFKNQGLGKIFTPGSRQTLFLARLLKDKDALSNAQNGLTNTKKVAIFVGLIILTMVINFLIKRKFPSHSLFDGFSKWIFRSTFITVIRLVIVLAVFGKELIPIIKIFRSCV